MAYTTTADLPEDVRAALPTDAQAIFLSAFNSAFEGEEDDAAASAAGWAAVKAAGFAKGDDGTWAKAASEADLGMSYSDRQSALCAAVDDALGIPDDAEWHARPYIRDVFDAQVVYEYDGSSYMADYSFSGGDVTLGDPVEVRVSYEPVGTAAPAPTQAGEGGGYSGGQRRRRRRSGATEAVAFDPKDKDSLESLAAAMLADGRFAAEVVRVAEKLRGDEVPTDFVALSESAVRSDGTAYIKLIQPGWGSSGYYGSEVLEKDGPVAFPKGTKMYWNHQTEAQEQERPEGDLRDLAGELLEDARWMGEGPQGAGLYANAKVFEDFQGKVNELAPHIGVSIRAYGKASEGSAEGREGTIIDSLTWGQSVDYVTEPGAGGRVLELFEAAGRSAKEEQMSEKDEKALKEAQDATKRAQEALAVRDAKDIVAKALGESELPEATQKRLVESLASKVTLDDEGKLDTKALEGAVEEAIKTEAAYLAELGAGSVRGMGSEGTPPEDIAKAKENIAKGLEGLGMSETAAKAAAAGR